MRQNKKSILIFGSTGMLGSKLYREAKRRNYSVIGASRNGQDINLNLLKTAEISRLISEFNPDTIINSAAIVSHDACEREETLAYAINAHAVKIMSLGAAKTGARLIQISTDNYYSGDGRRAHKEEEPVSILSKYAKTKFAGEEFALNYTNSLVIRTNITGFRPSGEIISFIEWAIDSLKSKATFNLFNDYYASTISTHQAAALIFDVLEYPITGRLNLASREVFSKSEFVEAFAHKTNLPCSLAKKVSVHTVLSARSESIGLDVSRAESLLKRALPDLDEVVSQLAEEYFDRQRLSN